MIADAHHLPLRNNTIESTFCKSVLEHLPNPYKALMEMKRVTTGKIILIVPNLIEIIRILRTLKNPLYSINPNTRHYQNWDSEEIRHLARQVGLEVYSVTWVQIDKPAWWKTLLKPLFCSHMMIKARPSSIPTRAADFCEKPDTEVSG